MKRVFMLLVLSLIIGCTTVKNDNENAYEVLSKSKNYDGLWYSDSFEGELSSDIIKEDDFSIMFWYKSNSNKPNSPIITLGDENNYVSLYPSIINNKDGIVSYSGITIKNNKGDTLSSENSFSMKSYRYNFIVIDISLDNIIVYLNGEIAINSKLKTKLNSNNIYIGLNPFDANGEIFSGEYSNLRVDSNNVSIDKVSKEYNENLPKVLLDTITISDADDLINGYWIDSYEIEGYPVKWISSNQEIIDYRGMVMKKVDKDTEVNLIATLEINGSTATKTFLVNVRTEDDNRLILRDLKCLDTYIYPYMYSNSNLPEVLPNGSKVEWTVSSGNASIENNLLVKTSEIEKEGIELSAIVSKGENSFTKTYSVILLDEIVGYIMSYFNGELGEEKGYLAYSYDGLVWSKLNIEITTELGSKRIRDPQITRDKDGKFVILATEGFDNPSIYIFKDEGLLDFSNQKLVQVSYFDEGLRMTGERAWAPEMIYDYDKNEYKIYFSDNGYVDEQGNKGGPIYAVSSNDLEHVSYPFIYFNPGYSVIDGSVISLDGKHWLFYKDERKAAQTIFYSSSDNLSGFNKAYDKKFLNLIKYMEGPFIFKNKDGGYFLYMDNYPNGKFYGASFNHLGEENDIEWFDENSIKLPEEDVRHGSVIEVTEKELNEIINKYK